jgi:hypothetical protein
MSLIDRDIVFYDSNSCEIGRIWVEDYQCLDTKDKLSILKDMTDWIYSECEKINPLPKLPEHD